MGALVSSKTDRCRSIFQSRQVRQGIFLSHIWKANIIRALAGFFYRGGTFAVSILNQRGGYSLSKASTKIIYGLISMILPLQALAGGAGNML